MTRNDLRRRHGRGHHVTHEPEAGHRGDHWGETHVAARDLVSGVVHPPAPAGTLVLKPHLIIERKTSNQTRAWVFRDYTQIITACNHEK